MSGPVQYSSQNKICPSCPLQFMGNPWLLHSCDFGTVPKGFSGANITTHFNPEKNKALPILVKPVIEPAESVTTDILKDMRAIIPVNNIPVAM